MSQHNYIIRRIYWDHVALEIEGPRITLSAGYGFNNPYGRIQVFEKCQNVAKVAEFLTTFCDLLEKDLYSPEKKGFVFPLDWTSDASRENYSWERKLEIIFELRDNGFPYIKIYDEFFDSPGFKMKCELDSILSPDSLAKFIEDIKQAIQDLNDFEGYYFTEESI